MRYKRQSVDPITYSVVSPLLLPRRTDLTICGSQMKEYVIAMKMMVSSGDRITRTIKVKKMTIITTIIEIVSTTQSIQTKKKPYVVWLVGQS